MDYKEVKRLLELYLEGRSSLKEEQLLSDYFNQSEDIPSDIIYAKGMFGQFKRESEETIETPIIAENNFFQLNAVKYISRIAAGLVLIASILYFSNVFKKETVYAYYNGVPISDEEQALKETKKALLLVSNNLNQGTKGLNYISKFNKVETLITKNN